MLIESNNLAELGYKDLERLRDQISDILEKQDVKEFNFRLSEICTMIAEFNKDYPEARILLPLGLYDYDENDDIEIFKYPDTIYHYNEKGKVILDETSIPF